MDRAQVIQRLLPRQPDSAYLEIGVQHGYTFDAVHAGLKVAVDPSFAFDVGAATQQPRNSNCRYYEVPSNEYFQSIRAESDLFDVIFIDGLHTFDQTLRDLLSAACCLRGGGVIVVDDVMPVSYASSISDLQHFTRFREATSLTDGSWMGDVYKIPFFVKNFAPLWSYATVIENMEQMVIWKAPSLAQNFEGMSIQSICDLSYSDFVLRKDILNLLPMSEIELVVLGHRD